MISYAKHTLRICLGGLLYVFGITGLWRRLSPHTGILILAYHRVNAGNHNPLGMAVPPEEFAVQMAYLAKHYRVVSLDDAVLMLEKRHPLPSNAVVLTFDDGYQDNYEFAFPILQKNRLPATIFLTVGPIDERGSLWYDTIIDLIVSAQLPCFWLTAIGEEQFAIRTPAEKSAAIRKIIDRAKKLTSAQFAMLLQELRAKLSRDGGQLPPCRMLSWQQIKEMQGIGMRFGGHTISHRILSALPREEVKKEIEESKKRIEQELGEPVQHFSYPNGKNGNFTSETDRLLREVGYRSACTLIAGENVDSDLYRLRRIGVYAQPFSLGPFLTKALFAAEIAGLFDLAFLRKWRQKGKAR